MATTIKLKNGSGAPLAGDLVQGEPALDLTNKRLYTEDSGGTVIEVGTNPTSLTTGTFTSTGIDDNATSTAITIDSSENVGIGTASPATMLELSANNDSGGENNTLRFTDISATTAANQLLGKIEFKTNDASGDGPLVRSYILSASADATPSTYLSFGTNLGGAGTVAEERMRIDSSGNVGIGTNSNIAGINLEIKKAGAYLGLNSTTAGYSLVRGYDNGTERWSIGQIGFGGADGMAFYTGSSNTERMRIDSSGNVGIGTSSPATIFHVDKPSASCSPIFSSGTGGVYLNMRGANDTHQIQYGDGAGSPTFALYDATAAATRMTIDSSGNVGIGTEGPVEKFHINSGNQLIKTAYDQFGTTSANIYFQSRASGNWRNSAIGVESNALTFSTGGVGTDHTSTTERMRLDASGNLLVGTTGAAVGTSTLVAQGVVGVKYSMLCQVASTSGHTQILFHNGSVVGGIVTAGSSTTYNTSSDERLKENIVDAPAGNIDAIRVRSFDWKADGTHQTYGMVAQELVDVAPEAVSKGETEDDVWGVDYSKLVPMMIKEIQDLKAEVAALKGAN